MIDKYCKMLCGNTRAGFQESALFHPSRRTILGQCLNLEPDRRIVLFPPHKLARKRDNYAWHKRENRTSARER